MKLKKVGKTVKSAINAKIQSNSPRPTLIHEVHMIIYMEFLLFSAPPKHDTLLLHAKRNKSTENRKSGSI